jgi:hypothetical protein
VGQLAQEHLGQVETEWVGQNAPESTVKRSKIIRYSVFPAVNSSKPPFTAVGREFTAVDESTPFG